MGILSAAASLLKLFFREANYRELSEEWFDDVWEHLDKVSSGKGELYETVGEFTNGSLPLSEMRNKSE